MMQLHDFFKLHLSKDPESAKTSHLRMTRHLTAVIRVRGFGMAPDQAMLLQQPGFLTGPGDVLTPEWVLEDY